MVDNFTAAYRPCSKAINYRSECFFERELTQQQHGFTPDEADDYGSYANGDMATPRPEMYVGDPYKIRLINAGSEMGHVFHEHGGAIRWLRNPGAANPDIAGGLEKNPAGHQGVDQTRLADDRAGRVLRPGDRVRRRRLPAGRRRLPVPLPHRRSLRRRDGGLHPGVRHRAVRAWPRSPAARPSPGGHLGRPDRQGHRGQDRRPAGPADRPEHPGLAARAWSRASSRRRASGLNAQDATVWNWAKSGTADAPVYLGEPEDTTSWADYTAPNPGQRPQIMFDPSNGRYAWPLLQPHLGERPPFSPNGHGGAPWLGPTASSTRPDGLCPASAPVRHLQHHRHHRPHPGQTNGGSKRQREPKTPPAVDPNGELFVLNQDKAACGERQPSRLRRWRSGRMSATA